MEQLLMTLLGFRYKYILGETSRYLDGRSYLIKVGMESKVKIGDIIKGKYVPLDFKNQYVVGYSKEDSQTDKYMSFDSSMYGCIAERNYINQNCWTLKKVIGNWFKFLDKPLV